MPKRKKRLTDSSFNGVDDVRLSRYGKSIVLVKMVHTGKRGQYRFYNAYYPNDAVNRVACRRAGYGNIFR